MTHTSRLLLVASVCALAVLYGDYAFALPYSHEYKGGGGKDWYGNDDWDDGYQWGDKKKKSHEYKHEYKKDGWGEHEPKKDWFTWGYGKEDEKWGAGMHWGKDPDCDPPMAQTPEPGTLLLLGSSLAAAGVAWRRRRGPRNFTWNLASKHPESPKQLCVIDCTIKPPVSARN